ncbi:MAG TPA: hypothetical protein VLR26_04495 [Frankiaceae bacterium]|nr:hypothetical protein [Frankiaceae bacterium]
MAHELRFEIGAAVTCTDSPCGQLTRVVFDPRNRIATHLIVEPRHRTGLGRLVPLDLVTGTTPQIGLTCPLASFERLALGEQVRLPGSRFDADLAGEDLMTVPFYGLDPGSNSFVSDFGGNADQPSVEDALPPGDVDVAAHERVHATDGPVGHIRGLIVRADDHRLTHVLLREGHLWERREVAIPMTAVVSVDAGIQLNLTRAEVGDLPPLEPGSVPEPRPDGDAPARSGPTGNGPRE